MTQREFGENSKDQNSNDVRVQNKLRKYRRKLPKKVITNSTTVSLASKTVKLSGQCRKQSVTVFDDDEMRLAKTFSGTIKTSSQKVFISFIVHMSTHLLLDNVECFMDLSFLSVSFWRLLSLSRTQKLHLLTLVERNESRLSHNQSISVARAR